MDDMGAHRMNVPEELAEYKLERAELAIALPSDWKLDEESLKDERWCWPIGLLKVLARLPIALDTWLGWGHTMDKESSFAENTDLCASILISPQGVEEGNETCTLPNGEVVNFYQVIPLYRDEMEYKLENDVDALFEKMEDILFYRLVSRSLIRSYTVSKLGIVNVSGMCFNTCISFVNSFNPIMS